MEVGIEDCLHIEFEYDRARYHLKDVVVGRIYFLLVRIKLKHMEVGLYVLLVSPAISHQHNQQACAPHALTAWSRPSATGRDGLVVQH
jgi:vacuolar protein sorting-associated protein 26